MPGRGQKREGETCARERQRRTRRSDHRSVSHRVHTILPRVRLLLFSRTGLARRCGRDLVPPHFGPEVQPLQSSRATLETHRAPEICHKSLHEAYRAAGAATISEKSRGLPATERVTPPAEAAGTERSNFSAALPAASPCALRAPSSILARRRFMGWFKRIATVAHRLLPLSYQCSRTAADAGLNNTYWEGAAAWLPGCGAQPGPRPAWWPRRHRRHATLRGGLQRGAELALQRPPSNTWRRARDSRSKRMPQSKTNCF